MKISCPSFRIIVSLLLCSAIYFFGGRIAFAEEPRSYRYDEIRTKITINKDTTFDVEEHQLYNFQGEYHKGWRSITKSGFDAITDVQVIDPLSGKSLVWSGAVLEKTDPSSWGKYTTYSENGSQIIEWYYDAKDEQRGWILKYKVHGGLSFLKDKDELYWNLFTNYDVPVLSSIATVRLPEGVLSAESVSLAYYNSEAANGRDYQGISLGSDFNPVFQSANISAKQKLTVAVGWPRGLIDRGAYWKDFAKIFWGYIVATIVVLSSILAAIWRWYFSEKYKQGRGVIVTQYEAPNNLAPAMVGLIWKERTTMRTWPATIVDLAVRGYIQIAEEEDSEIMKRLRKAGAWIAMIIPLGILLFIGVMLLSAASSIGAEKYYAVVPVIIVLVILTFLLRKRTRQTTPSDYVLTLRNIEYQKDASLRDFEKKLLSALFLDGTMFSTKAIRNAAPTVKMDFSKIMQELPELLQTTTEEETKAYAIGFKANKYRLFFAVFGGLLILLGGGMLAPLLGNQLYAVVAALVFAIGIYFWMKYETRLNKEGQVLRENVLGFKRYLEVVEAGPVQNLTPETFQKFLPYAMVFGVEKKWAEAFAGVHMGQPQWYHGTTVNAVGITGGGFSPTAFASTFGASFSSSFASSGAGASGGGGSAGGGGGGGGGGAS